MKTSLAKIAYLALCALITGCTTLGPKHSAPDPQALLTGASLTPDYRNNGDVLTQWWTYFEDQRLEELVNQAIENNRSLIALRSNLKASRANLNLARIDYLPNDVIDASSTTSRQSAAALGQVTELTETDLYSVSFAPKWDLDLFGVVSRRVQMAKRSYQSQEALLSDLQLVVIGEVTSQYFQRQSLAVERSILTRNIDLQSDSLRISEALYQYGRGTKLNLLNARAQLRATQAQLPPVLAAMSQTEARIAVLTGRAPGALSKTLEGISSSSYIQHALPIGELSELIRRQPSIRVAERNLARSVSEIGLAVSSMFPQVSLIGTVGYSAQDDDQLGDDNSLQFSYGPTLTWSLSNLIRGKQNINAAKYRSGAAFAEYEDSVLAALEDLNIALTNQKSARDRQPLLDSALTDSQESARIAKAQYELGSTAFNDLLDAEQRLLQQELNTNSGIYDIIAAQIAVFRALGAG